MESNSKIIIFTDGACKRNGKPGAVGSIGVYFPNGEFASLSEKLPFDSHTNQRAELYAIIRALEVTKTSQLPLEIYTDSKYCYNIIESWLEKWIKKGQQKQNWDLVMQLHDHLKGRTVIMQHLRGHQRQVKVPKTDEERINNYVIGGNIEADRLATSAIRDL